MKTTKKIKSDLIILTTLTIFTDLTTLTILKDQKNYGEYKCRICIGFEVHEIILFSKLFTIMIEIKLGIGL